MLPLSRYSLLYHSPLLHPTVLRRHPRHNHRQGLPGPQPLPVLLPEPYARRVRPIPLYRFGARRPPRPRTLRQSPLNHCLQFQSHVHWLLKGTLIHKIFPGEFFAAGRQGRKDKGEVTPPDQLIRNTETIDSKAFLLEHSRPGVVSLCLSENDDDDDLKLNTNYHNVEFFINTGPGSCPRLDRNNIVFGSVLEGLDVVTAVASIPTYKPSERIRQYNEFAEFLQEERAKTARAIWNRPLKTLYISDCSELLVAKHILSPTPP